VETVEARQLDPKHPRRVVVVGGGYAGITFAVTLAHLVQPSDGVEIVLVDPRPYQQALPELDMVVAGTPRPQFAELWHGAVLRDLPVKVVYERLENVCPQEHRIALGPRGRPTAELDYWRLVLATGAIPHIPPIPGLVEAAATMWSVRDAQFLQRRIERAFETAVTVADPEERRRALSFAVIGAGATGVEMAGAIAAVLPRMIRRAGYDPSQMKLTLIEARPDILYDLPETLRARARARLRKMGIELVLGHGLVRVENGTAHLEGGLEVPAAVIVWCGGAQADPDAADWGLAADNSGRLVCDASLKAKGQDDIYVVGDVAAFHDPRDGKVLPMLAQFAISGAAATADNVLREVRGDAPRPFVPRMHGEFVSVGPRWGVGWMFRFSIWGWPVVAMKRLTYVIYWVQVGSYRLAWSRTRQLLRPHR
jgi:NADH dehydrogenase